MVPKSPPFRSFIMQKALRSLRIFLLENFRLLSISEIYLQCLVFFITEFQGNLNIMTSLRLSPGGNVESPESPASYQDTARLQLRRPIFFRDYIRAPSRRRRGRHGEMEGKIILGKGSAKVGRTSRGSSGRYQRGTFSSFSRALNRLPLAEGKKVGGDREK